MTAKPEIGYRFVNWTGDVSTIARISAARTTITVNGNYAIMANFEEKPPVSGAFIGGIIGAVIVAGIVIFIVRRKKGVQREGRGKKATGTKRR